ncbi:MAG: hypothetical protein RL038_823 [Actinomycetota bacterium]
MQKDYRCHGGSVPCTQYLGAVRVVHITDVYLPKLGGIEKQIQALAAAQSRAGDDVTILTATAGAVIENVTRIESKLSFGLPINFFALTNIREYLIATKPEVVHLHVGGFSQFAWYGAIAARQCQIPVVATVHSIWGTFAQFVYRLLNRIWDWDSKISVSAVSTTAAAAIQQVAKQKVWVTPNGVDLTDWQPQARTPTTKLRLVTATRLAARKRVLPLLRVVQAVAREYKDIELRIAGSGISELLLKQYVKLWRLEKYVTFVGRLSKTELQRLYAESDLFIQLSVKEAFGLAAIEARATGLPVIGRVGNGFVEFIDHGVDGQLFESDKAVAKYLIRLIQTPSELERIQTNAQVKVQHSWDKTLASVHLLYGQ